MWERIQIHLTLALAHSSLKLLLMAVGSKENKTKQKKRGKQETINDKKHYFKWRPLIQAVIQTFLQCAK